MSSSSDNDKAHHADRGTCLPPFESPSDNNELDELETLLEHHGSDHSIISMSMLDGFLTAVVSGPHLIMPSIWLHAIWGDEQDQPEWQSEAELERFIDLVMRHSNDIATTLTYAPEDYFPVAPEFERHGEWVPLIHDWCGGYLGGLELAPWPTLPAPEAAALAMIAEPLEKMPTSLEALSNEHLQEQATKARFAARILHAHFLAQRSERPARPQPVVAPIKIGRNASCPCGSGKKYKQCCLH